jgi:hypothetical protein
MPLTDLILTSACTSREQPKSRELQKIRIRVMGENKDPEFVLVDPGDRIKISRAPVRYGTDFSELHLGHYLPKPLDAVFYYCYSPRMPEYTPCMPEYTPRVTYLSYGIHCTSGNTCPPSSCARKLLTVCGTRRSWGGWRIARSPKLSTNQSLRSCVP